MQINMDSLRFWLQGAEDADPASGRNMPVGVH
jgi:hypothetical protein